MLQTIMTITSQPEGALELLSLEDISPLVEIAAQYPYALDILKLMWTNASTISDEVEKVQRSIDRTMPILLNVFKDTDAVTLIQFVGEFMSKINPNVSPLLVALLRPFQKIYVHNLHLTRPFSGSFSFRNALNFSGSRTNSNLASPARFCSEKARR
jgi:hypothetical protein